MKPVPLARRREDGPPVYAFMAEPGLFPLGTRRFDRDIPAHGPTGAHAHDFLVLAFFERGAGMLRIADREWRVGAGDLYLVAPGEVVGSGLEEAEGWAVFFPPEVLGAHAPGSFLAWHAHPLLVPFVRGTASGVQRLRVPPADQADWSARILALDRELAQRREGYREAALAHLTLLLVGVARLAADVVGDLRLNDEPLLAAVFGHIEQHYREPISLRDMARAVHLSPGHLTTVIRRKTGRTVLEWIAARRMTEARRLLVETGLTVEEVGRRAGYGEAGYFVRSFRAAHGTTPLGWRRANRP